MGNQLLPSLLPGGHRLHSHPFPRRRPHPMQRLRPVTSERRPVHGHTIGSEQFWCRANGQLSRLVPSPGQPRLSRHAQPARRASAARARLDRHHGTVSRRGRLGDSGGRCWLRLATSEHRRNCARVAGAVDRGPCARDRLADKFEELGSLRELADRRYFVGNLRELTSHHP